MPGHDDFAGDWILTRRIDDRMSGQIGRFTGTARLTPDGPATLRYAETGELRLGRLPPMRAERRYLWHLSGDRVTVRFEDGSAFHSFRAQGTGQGTDHPCGADFYRVAYDFTAFPLWTARWTVTGPRKDYDMHTTFHRG